MTGEDGAEPGRAGAPSAGAAVRPAAREHVQDAPGAGRRAPVVRVPDPRRGGMGAARGDPDLRRRRRGHHGADRRAPRDRGRGGRALRRRAAHATADRAPGGCRAGGRGPDRPAREPHRDPDGRRERHRQDDHDRQDRVAPAQRARQVGPARRRRHVPRRGCRAVGGVGRARGLRRDPGGGGVRPGVGGLRRGRGRPHARARRGDRRHGRAACTPRTT